MNYSVIGNGVYKPVSDTVTNIINKHSSLCDRFGVSKGLFEECIPLIYAIPKLHKNPYKFRFIAGAKRSSIKPISCVLHSILQYFRKLFCNYNRTYKSSNCGRGNFYSVEGTNALMFLLDKIKRKCNKICTADFSTLFTNLSHNDIYKAMKFLIEFLFNRSKKMFLILKSNKVFFSDKFITSKSSLCYTKAELNYLLYSVVNETYITFAGIIFKQIKGVPMGGNASPDIADLTLSMFEYKNSQIDRPFTEYIFRYVDDLLICNCNNFDHLVQTLYENKLKVEKTHEGLKAEFLDLDIELKNGWLEFKVYNKTDKFAFEVNRSINLDSNVELIIHYGVLYTQTLRFLRICTNLDDFVQLTKKLILQFENAGFSKYILMDKLKQFLLKKKLEFCKFGYQYSFHDGIFKVVKNIFDTVNSSTT